MITQHAQARMQSRAMPHEAVDALLAFGEVHRHQGADVCYLDRHARSRVEKSLSRDEFRQLEKCLNAYIVVSDNGNIITAARRYGRLRF